ncbi:MAG: TIGR00282 family metallophosphoesterase [Verrucomicrobia bacterium]|nr:TIGR00282 family metallophosphoesterase [Verrucomicrobiota bacterium]MDA1067800.1 TIGR00282 family metallophosphoesterase [Verrucomicrobiota bacterium]
MKILVLGDIVGRPGRNLVVEKLALFREISPFDCIIANGENAAAGAGITGKIVNQLIDAGVNGLTLGDHTWDQKIFLDEIDSLENVCRPANFAPEVPGKDRLVLEIGSIRIGLFTVLGRNFMGPKVDCPFRTADRLILELAPEVDVILAEIHAEATSEKIAFGWYLDGRVGAVFGTHTHVPTADAEILPEGTAYISDLGMSGPYDGVLGRDKVAVISRFIDGIPRRFPVAEKDVRLSGVILEVNELSGKAESISHHFWLP